MTERTHSQIFKVPLSVQEDFLKWLFGSKYMPPKNKELDISKLSDGDRRQLGKTGIQTGLWTIENRVVLVPTKPGQLQESKLIWKTDRHAVIETNPGK